MSQIQQMKQAFHEPAMSQGANKEPGNRQGAKSASNEQEVSKVPRRQ